MVKDARSAGHANRRVATWIPLAVVLGLALAGPARTQAADSRTEQARTHYQRAEQLFDLGRWDEAIAEYELAYQMRGDPIFLFDVAQCYRRKGDTKRAIDLYKNFLRKDPKSQKRGEVEDRIEALEKELLEKEKLAAPPARIETGSRAAQSAGGATGLPPAPGNASAQVGPPASAPAPQLWAPMPAASADWQASQHDQNGRRLYAEGRLGEAVNAFGQAYAINHDPALLYNLGLCYRRLGYAQHAIGLFQEYLRWVPDSPKRPSIEARIRELQAELFRAPAPAQAPAPPSASREAAPARGALPASVTQESSRYEQNGRRLYDGSRWAEAATEFERAYSLGNDPALLYNLGLCYRKAGDAQRALALFEYYLHQVPDSPKRPSVEVRIRELKQELAAARANPP